MLENCGNLGDDGTGEDAGSEGKPRSVMTTRRAIVKAAGGILLAGPAACVSSSRRSEAAAGVPGNVPAKYRALYAELDGRLNVFLRNLPTERPGQPLRAASLLTVNAHVGEKLFSDEWRHTHRLYLDHLRALNADAIVLEVSYPILTPGFVDAEVYLEFYADMAREIRQRGMRVAVKHNTLLPGYTALPVARYYRGLDAARFGRERYVEAAHIVSALKPDFLSLVGEPGTHNDATGLDLTVGQWTGYVRAVVERLPSDVPNHGTLLGAGAGTWESAGYFEGYARIPGLDYVDIHIYPLSNGFQDYLQIASTWSRRVRSIDPSKGVIIGETWLYKAGRRELARTAANKTIFARDVYDFWEPLDVKFLRAIDALSRSESFVLYAPFWTRYFFAYLDASSPKLAGKRPDELMELANRAAFVAMSAGRTTATGRVFAAL